MKTLIITDVQHDFMPGGALGVPGANAIVPVINRLIPKFEHVLATLDWHPPHHISFASSHGKKVGEKILVAGHEQILWPDHCVQNTRGARLADGLHQERIEAVFHKGTDLKIDSYSTFFDNARTRHTGLAEHLRKHGLKDLYFVGLATDYCVLYSVLDALELGFNVWVIRDACRAINLKPGDEERA
ncbi:MAG TPA: bifunctional nicotinamidase/pyrazinamidase, partial [Chlamydiales bacterium]|nr:bifunctional nicotinamidase/pyrazinamidase [Chlamydiales bacterium]